METTKNPTFGRKMFKLRMKIHMQAKELSRITGIDPTVISRYEKDKRVPNWENAQKIMVALGAKMGDF